MQSPQAQRKIRAAGGTAKVSLALVNLYDEEYPNYGVPLATLTASALDAAGVHRTFVIASRLLHRLLAGLQSGAGVRPHNRISAQIIGDTGVAAQPGSPNQPGPLKPVPVRCTPICQMISFSSPYCGLRSHNQM